MSIKNVILFCCFLCAVYVPVSASTGTYAMSFSDLVTNPYTDSLANTVTAINNPNALFINPAGLSNKHKRVISAQLFKYVEDIEYKQFQMIQPYLNGNIALSYTWLDYGSYQQTTLLDKIGSSTDVVSSKASLIHLSYARELFNTGIGISGKYIEETLVGYKAEALVCDLGIQRALSNTLLLGMSINNLPLSKVKFINKDSYVRKSARIGIKYSPKLFKEKIILLTDYIYFDDKDLLSYASIIKVHEKLDINVGSNKLSNLFNVSLGVGVHLGAFDIDVSYKNLTDFSDVYRVQVGLRF